MQGVKTARFRHNVRQGRYVSKRILRKDEGGEECVAIMIR